MFRFCFRLLSRIGMNSRRMMSGNSVEMFMVSVLP